MPVYLPDCLDISSNDLITGCSTVDGIYLADMLGDYQIGNASLMTKEDNSYVYFFVFSYKLDSASLYQRLSDVGLRNIRKLYLVYRPHRKMTFLRIWMLCSSLRYSLESGDNLKTPMLYSDDGCRVMSLQKYCSTTKSIGLIKRFKNALKYYLQLVKTISCSNIIVFDASECLN